MIIFEPKYFSIVFLGNQNPSILNNDFLVSKNILPLDKPPFSKLDFTNINKPPFNDILSTPVVARIIYENISLVIEESRFQITDTSNIYPFDSPIITIARNYFSVLRHTPLVTGGFNFNGLLRCESEADQKRMESKLCVEKPGLVSVLNAANVNFGINFSYKIKNGMATITLNRIRENQLEKNLNSNYEFPFEGMDGFLKNLDEVKPMYEYFMGFVDWIKHE